jgi:transcriptional regulator with XRE-family HTH domain
MATRTLPPLDPAAIRELRKARGLTQCAVAKTIDVTPGAICRFESGECQPGADTAVAPAEALSVPLRFLIDTDALVASAVEDLRRKARRP